MASSAPEYQHLLNVSAGVGADPLLVQGAGGNTSIKLNDVLWIKASGTWLMHAHSQNIMVPVRLPELRQALKENAAGAERAEAWVVDELNSHRLRPSIETTLHAVLPQKVVLHVHCVETIALAVREDAATHLAPLLKAFNWRYVPYAKPGIELSQAISGCLYDNRHTAAEVVVLGNHGLIVAADSVDAAQQLLQQVCTALKQPVRTAPMADINRLTALSAHSDYELPAEVQAHAVALDDHSLAVAGGGSLYPDHVIFLGEGSVIAGSHETPGDVTSRCEKTGRPAPESILFPGIGVLMKKAAGKGAHAMARCLADVCARVSNDSPVNYLTSQQNHELLNWDAEKYRQTLNSESR